MASGDISLKRGASFALTIAGLASLATSSTRTAGVESDAVTTTDPEVDYIVGGKIRGGTTPTVNKQIDIWVYGSINDTPLYPDVLDGTNSAETLTSENVRNSALALAAVLVVDATTGRDYFIHPFSVASLFGGVLPKFWGIFIAHDTVAALDATAGNHAIYATPVYANVTP